MKHWFISRHPGAVEWANQHGVSFDKVIPHLDDVSLIGPNDNVYGVLPVNMAEIICAQGARYFHLSFDVPADLRGTELTAEQLENLNAQFQEYRITKGEGMASDNPAYQLVSDPPTKT